MRRFREWLGGRPTAWSRIALAAVAVIAVGSAMASCGGDGPPTAEAGPPAGALTISAWPGFVDPGDEGTVAQFEAVTGVAVKENYREDVAAEESLFEELEPKLERGKSGGNSILIVSDWMAKQMYERGFLQELDHDDLPTVFENLQPLLANPVTDPERKFTVPWQGRMTGIWIDRSEAQFDSVVEFFGPDLADETTMLADIRQSVPLVIMAESKDPVSASTADWLEAIRRIRLAVEVGQIHDLTGTEYTAGLNSGKLLAAVGSSVDAPLVRNPDVEWIAPAQGCVLSAEEMVIPVGAPNPAAAIAWMNYVYQPQVAANISDYLRQVSPVEGIQQILEQRKSPQADNPLIFPSREDTENCSDEVSPPNERVEEAWQDALDG
jgi:spermidine/putrescine transport system substrate-binding protein